MHAYVLREIFECMLYPVKHALIFIIIIVVVIIVVIIIIFRFWSVALTILSGLIWFICSYHRNPQMHLSDIQHYITI